MYTPPCYDSEARQTYPLLVLIHGSTFRDDQWDRIGADETADRLISTGEIPPLVILMPRDRVWRDPPEDMFDEALLEAILPWMEKNYHITSDRENRAVGGLSRGGAWAIHLGIRYPNVFGHIGAHSPTVFWSDTPDLRRLVRETPLDTLPRIYIDTGKNDFLIESAMWFENMLTEEKIPHEWYLFNGRHEEAYWTAHMEDYLRWYSQGWVFDLLHEFD